MDGLEVRSNSMGRGVYATKVFVRGDVIEKCHVVTLPNEEVAPDTKLETYVFVWANKSAFLLGNGSLYNHSYEPNAMYARDFEASMMNFVCLRNIAVGEEIFINYNGVGDMSPREWPQND